MHKRSDGNKAAGPINEDNQGEQHHGSIKKFSENYWNNVIRRNHRDTYRVRSYFLSILLSKENLRSWRQIYELRMGKSF